MWVKKNKNINIIRHQPPSAKNIMFLQKEWYKKEYLLLLSTYSNFQKKKMDWKFSYEFCGTW